MSRRGDVYENRVTGERAVVLRGDEDGPGEPGLVLLTVRARGAVVAEHLHPRVSESFTVVAGTLGYRVDGREGILSAGERVSAPAGTPHDWWNAGDAPASVIVELDPPDPRFEMMIATLFGLANDGQTNAKGMPDPLQLALTAQEFSDVIRFTRPPAVVQKLAFGLLGAIGRRRGKRGFYPDYLGPHGHEKPDAAVLALAGLDREPAAP